ncbi:MaoC/PaaZ C-terminal domain-containing protein [Rhodococcus sp. X156]|uniref:MaoC/PaaZ C-terminal domain-containing protein n=1 Tax=Rhodococcus sp. X156 TaxID=2499145 RepID=UPI001F49EA77|nr:MaoC/PaaZ C-terminal domain-containing protein [Rhodococcus sp. X156]
MSTTTGLDPRPAGEWAGTALGTRTVAYDERDAILYALAVGAAATDLDLVFERDLRVLPTFALSLAQWAPDALGSAGGFDTRTSVHGAQELTVLKPLPRSGELTMSASVGQVWDKGAAAVFEVAVESEYFVATWSIFGPGSGGFGGERGPGKPPAPSTPPTDSRALPTSPRQAVLYRLTGDRHPIHVDPVAAAGIGQPRPIMHGLCTVATAMLGAADALGAHPADLAALAGRFAAPAFPGDTLRLDLWQPQAGPLAFEVHGPDGAAVVSAGRLAFA